MAPVIGRVDAQLKVVSGFEADTFVGGKVKGKRCPHCFLSHGQYKEPRTAKAQGLSRTNRKGHLLTSTKPSRILNIGYRKYHSHANAHHGLHRSDFSKKPSVA